MIVWMRPRESKREWLSEWGCLDELVSHKMSEFFTVNYRTHRMTMMYTYLELPRSLLYYCANNRQQVWIFSCWFYMSLDSVHICIYSVESAHIFIMKNVYVFVNCFEISSKWHALFRLECIAFVFIITEQVSYKIITRWKSSHTVE